MASLAAGGCVRGEGKYWSTASDGASSTGETDTVGTEGPGASSTGSTDAGGGASSTGGDDGAVVLGCGLAEPCATILARCLPPDCPNMGDDELEYPPEMICVFEQLAASGQLQFRFDLRNVVGEEEWIDIAAFADGSAVLQDGFEDVEGDLMHVYHPPEACTLQPPSWFQGCLDAPVGDPEHDACLDPAEWLAGECAPTETCP